MEVGGVGVKVLNELAFGYVFGEVCGEWKVRELAVLFC